MSSALSTPVANPQPLVRTGRPPPAAIAWLALAAAVGAAAALGASGGSGNPTLVGFARALTVGAPLAVGFAALRRRPGDRFAVLLVVTGGACLVATLAESGDPVAHSVGRAAAWLVEILLVYMILAFPSGRLQARIDRLLVAAMGAVIGVLFLPRLLLDDRLDGASQYTSFFGQGPSNPFALVGHESGLVHGVLCPAGMIGIALVSAAVVVRLVHRTADFTPLTRRMYLPVVVLAGVRALLVTGLFLTVHLPYHELVHVLVWLTALSVPAIALAYGACLLRWQLLSSRALRQLGQSIGAIADSGELRTTLSRALEDPTLTVVVPAAGGGWIDERGSRLDPAMLRTHELSEVRDDGKAVAAIVHDKTLSDAPMLLDAATAIAGAVLANQRLVGESTIAVRELGRSRARLGSSAERERRRIETTLRDGAEQRLAALRVSFPLVADEVRHDAGRGLVRLRRLEEEVEATLDDIRTFAHGMCPPLLADRGLVAALRAQPAQASMPLRVEASDLGPCRPEVESAVYFYVLEVLRQAAEHAEPHASAVLALTDGDDLRFRLAITGAVVPYARAVATAGGGAPTPDERLAAVDGHAEFRAARDGTVLDGVVPSPRPRAGGPSSPHTAA